MTPATSASVLAQLQHENMIEAIALAAASARSPLIRREDGVALIASGVPFRLFNQVIVEGDGAKPHAVADAVADAVAVVRNRGDRFMVNLRAGTDDSLIPLMTSLGLAPLSGTPWTPGMALHPIAPTDEAATDHDHRIVEVTDLQGVEEHIVTATAGFELPETILREVVGPAILASPVARLYVGYVNGAPVSTGLGVRTGRTIGVYNISTVPSARRRGYGAQMTVRVASDGARAGCDVAILQASDMGYPIYQRLGYRTVVEYVGYVDAAPSPSPAG